MNGWEWKFLLVMAIYLLWILGTFALNGEWTLQMILFGLFMIAEVTVMAWSEK